MTDIEIVNGCRNCERKAQRELYDKYAPRLLAVVLRYEPRREAAQDVLQDALIKAFSSFKQFEWRGEGSLRAWLERLTINQSLNYLRESKRIVYDDLEGISVGDLAEPTADEVTGISQQKILDMIAELPPGYRTIFNLFCIDEYSHKEISKMLGINEKSSSSQLFRAKALLAKKVKAYLKEHEYEK